MSLASWAQKVSWQDGALVERTFLILKKDVFLEFQVRYQSEKRKKKHSFFFPVKVHIVNNLGMQTV